MPGPIMTRQPRVVVGLSHAQDAVRWRDRHARGEVLDPTPYGYHLAADRFDMRWTVSHREPAAIARVRTAVAARLGFDLLHAWRNRALLRSADVVWTHTEREHLAVAAVLGRHGPPVLAQSVWLWDAWPRYGTLRRSAIAWLLRRQPVEVVHSRVNLAVSREAVPGRRVELVPFGSATLPSVREHPSARPPVALAVGNDADRDWPLLATVARLLPGVRFRVVSGSRAAREIRWPANVERRQSASRDALVEWMREASCVVVPLRANRHASGTTTCIEAMGAGRPLVVTGAGGIEDYVSGCARLVEVADATAMASAIRDAIAGRVPAPGVGSEVSHGLTQADYVERYARITEWLLGGDWDAAVSHFRPLGETVTPPEPGDA